jgi:hypothetical protein
MASAESFDGAFYRVRVMHRRHVAPRYRFVYRLFYLLVDVDRVGALDARLRLFSHNRFNLVSLHDRDHGDGRPGGLRAWVERVLAIRDIRLDGGRILLLALPRVLGFAFNPISLYYCEHRDGRLRAVIAEVRNTFGERHCYLLAGAGGAMRWEDAHDTDKRFHVSPFFELTGRYRFRLGPPAATVRVHIREFRDDAPLLDASLAGERHALTDAGLLRQVARMPWVTLKVVLAIHFEALKLWLRGAKVVTKPEPPAAEVS